MADASAPKTHNATYGDPYRECIRPKEAGRYLSSPLTNRIRADPLTQAEVDPAIEATVRTPSGNRSHFQVNPELIRSIACIMPWTTLISDCGTATTSERVDPTYAIAHKPPPRRIARGNV